MSKKYYRWTLRDAVLSSLTPTESVNIPREVKGVLFNVTIEEGNLSGDKLESNVRLVAIPFDRDGNEIEKGSRLFTHLEEDIAETFKYSVYRSLSEYGMPNEVNVEIKRDGYRDYFDKLLEEAITNYKEMLDLAQLKSDFDKLNLHWSSKSWLITF